jgi:Fur family transcriptional regulator, ferric uptake regulator
MTTQRQLILETLDELGGHPTAEQIYNAVCSRDHTVDPSTVYRTLSWLADAGLVSEQRFGPGRQSRRTERFDPSRPTEHHHFVCTACGRVVEFESIHIERSKEEFARKHGVVVERASLTLYGLCSECQH